MAVLNRPESGGTLFCWLFLATLAACLACVCAFDIAVDPYDIFATPRIAGLNARKPAAATHQMMTKTYAADRVRPVTLLLGSSRVDVGLDPASSAFPPGMRPVFNFGIGGQTYAGDLLALREALAGGRLKYALLMVDFELALKDEPDLPAEHVARAKLTPNLRPNPGRAWQRAKDEFLATLTLGAFLDSLRTVVDQTNPAAPDMAEDGASSDAELRAHTHDDGVQALFAEKDRDDEARDAAGARYLAAHIGQVPSLREIASIVAFCRDHGIALTLIIPPMQASALAQWQRYGLSESFRAWKTGLVAIAGDTPLWDFSASSPWTTENPRATSPPSWFWESLHFKRSLGELLLRRILQADPTPFGTRVERH